MPDPQRSHDSPSPPNAGTPPIRVLLIEDDPAEAGRIREALEKAGGFQIERAEEVEEGLGHLERGEHDLVLLDLGPPGGNALEPLTRLSAAETAVPVIALFAAAEGEDPTSEALRLGARDCLPRFADGALLVRVLRHAVERERLLRELESAQQRAHQLATRDPLTGLHNRLQLDEHLARALAYAERNAQRLAVLVLGLDRFKHVNESLGHAAGDELLRKTAQRLAQALRGSDITTRHGGDRFAVVLPKIDRDPDAGKVADKILTSLAAPHLMGGSEYWVTASIGIAVYPRDGSTPEHLVRNAELAMYGAKATGGGYRFFDHPLNEASSKKLALERRLRRALADRVLQLYYQPKVDLRTGAIVGAEALMRWSDPELGQVSPVEFIPVAEETGLIDALGEWTLEEACTQTRAWQREGFPSLRIAVNISALEVTRERLREKVGRALSKSELEPAYLDLEITEGALMRHEGMDVLKEIKAIGLGVSLDDFGTGFSSLSHLKSAPVDTVKIDCSFVRDLMLDPHDEAIVSAILLLAGKLGLTVVAEGVETEAQRAFLSSRGCHQMQGFLVSPAVPPAQFLELLRGHPVNN